MRRNTAVTAIPSLPGQEHSANEDLPVEVREVFRTRGVGEATPRLSGGWPGADAEGHSGPRARHGAADHAARSSPRPGRTPGDAWRFGAGLVIGLFLAGGVWLVGFAITGRITLLP